MDLPPCGLCTHLKNAIPPSVDRLLLRFSMPDKRATADEDGHLLLRRGAITARSAARPNSMPCDIVLRWLGRLRLVYGLDTIENLTQITLRDLNIMVDLQIEPKLGRCAQRLAESKRSIGCNARLLAGDPLNSRSRQAADLGKSARGHFERNKELLPQNLPRMHGLELFGHLASSSSGSARSQPLPVLLSSRPSTLEIDR